MNRKYLDIYNFYSNKVYKNFLIRNIKEEKDILAVGCLLRKKGFKMPKFTFSGLPNHDIPGNVNFALLKQGL